MRLHPDIDKISSQERMPHILEDLGPTFIKFSQVLSTHKEMVTPEMYDELIKLQDNISPIPFEDLFIRSEMNFPILTIGTSPDQSASGAPAGQCLTET